MQYRKLGQTDVDVSVICQGCWSLIGGMTWGDQDRDDSVDAIHAALDEGINFFDTAEGYGGGESEQILGRALAARRKDVVVASKVSPNHLQPDKLIEHCEQSLRTLGSDWIDLYQIHWPSPTVPIADSLAAMETLRAAGKIRFVGVSNFGAGYLGELLAAGRVESNQLCYSLLWRGIEHEIQPLCEANDIGILCYSPICQGLLTGKFATVDDVPDGRARSRLFSKDRPEARHDEPGCEAEAFEAIDRIREMCAAAGVSMTAAALAWLLAQPAVTSVIAGGRNAEQTRQNARAGEVALPNEVLTALSDATETVKAHIGTNCDMWQGQSRMER